MSPCPLRDAYLGYAKALALQVSVKPRNLDAFDIELTKVKVPFYANHLVEAGTRLPVWVDPKRPDRATVDWPVAATEDPGVGKPPAAVLGDVRTLFGGG